MKTTTVEENIRETYLAALQHSLIDVPDDAVLVGVVRRDQYGLGSKMDYMMEELAPPDALLEEFLTRSEELREEGLTDSEAHNQALSELNFMDRYRSHIASSEPAETKIEKIIGLAHDRPVYLTCYENTDDKHCHRIPLQDHIRKQIQ